MTITAAKLSAIALTAALSGAAGAQSTVNTPEIKRVTQDLGACDGDAFQALYQAFIISSISGRQIQGLQPTMQADSFTLRFQGSVGARSRAVRAGFANDQIDRAYSAQHAVGSSPNGDTAREDKHVTEITYTCSGTLNSAAPK